VLILITETSLLLSILMPANDPPRVTERVRHA
jgi:hypothetical protein